MTPTRTGVGSTAARAFVAALAACLVSMPAGIPVTAAQDVGLTFDKNQYTTIAVTIDGRRETVRWYKELCYVARPVLASNAQGGGRGGPATSSRCGYQSMNVFVAERASEDSNAVIYLAVNNGGWFASYVRASVTDGATFDSATSHVGAALKAGYVYIDVATRSRGLVAPDGTYPGKAPAVVVDAKAAVRYLRQNDATMPGSAERIVANGTSGGGALVAALGASGNSPDYFPYLAAIGAAGITSQGRSTIADAIFAVVAYCPITDLGHADLAYEWVYSSLGTRKAVGFDPDPKGSAALAAAFPAYQQSLRLRDTRGQLLLASTMMAAIEREVIRSAEIFMKASPENVIPDLGQAMTYTTGGGRGAPAEARQYVNDWIAVDNAADRVLSVNMARYLVFVATQARLKGTPAFDPVGVSSAAGYTMSETNLFGSSTAEYSNFTEFSWQHNDTRGDGSGADDTDLSWPAFLRQPSTVVDEQIRLIDPLQYIGTSAVTAPYWYIRHGTRDRDTAFTVSLNLSRKLAADSSVADVNYQLAWNRPHAGNYDVPEAMAWIANSVNAAQARRPSR